MGNISFSDFCEKNKQSSTAHVEAFGRFKHGTNMEGVDLRIRPVDELLCEVAPFHHQQINLQTTGYNEELICVG